jgi:tetratricopeptide (TPR) repeat protein
VTEQSRIEELRRRLQHDPTSIAFAQLAEALRREGQVQEAIETCRAGLVHHAGYVSAHVTLGRALIEAGELDAAEAELSAVLVTAPENLAAIRGLADICERRGQPDQALEHYRRALALAPNDTELEGTVSRLAADSQPPVHDPVREPEPPPADLGPSFYQPVPEPEPPADETAASDEAAAQAPPPEASPASRQVEALERWLDAILAERERQA